MHALRSSKYIDKRLEMASYMVDGTSDSQLVSRSGSFPRCKLDIERVNVVQHRKFLSTAVNVSCCQVAQIQTSH